MSQEKNLVLKFEPSTIEHLGVKMYSHVPPALAELIANAYDACATEVRVNLYNKPVKKIVVSDNGCGMNFNEVNDYFLRIGRNRRKESQTPPCDRKPTGKKGLGKLALFGLGNVIDIETTKDGQSVNFILNYDDILASTNSRYAPVFEVAKTANGSGTKITLSELKHKSDFILDNYRASLSRLFNFQDANFKLFMSLDDDAYVEVTNKMKFEGLDPEFEWSEKEIFSLVQSSYPHAGDVRGRVVTTEKPIKPELRGIALFANGRMINASEFYGRSESSHFYSYVSGYLDVDFVDDWIEDVISTNRQSIDWELEESIALRNYLLQVLTAIEKDWRAKRESKRKQDLQVSTGIDISSWRETLPESVDRPIEILLGMMESSELSTAEQSRFVDALHDIAPEYPLLHWRHLHSEIRDAAQTDYHNTDYYRAFLEAVKRYVKKVREKSSKHDGTDQSIMGAVFGDGKSLLVANSFLRPDNSRFNVDTYKSIEEGQKLLSMGIVAGARNPISHEEISDLRDSNLFTEKDCLDMLSLLSHLFKRLEDSTVSRIQSP